MPFLAGEGGEALAVLDVAAEHRLFRDAQGLALGVVSPAVEPAGDAHRLAVFLAHQPRAAVRADVEERADQPVLAAGDDDRHAEIVERAEAAGFGNVGRKAGDLRAFAEQQAEFLFEELGVPVGFDIEEHHFVGQRGLAGIHVIENAREHVAPHVAQRVFGDGVDAVRRLGG